MLYEVAPRLWESANRTIEAILENDLRLHLPFEIANDGPRQPTAFAEVQYRFSVNDSVPRPSTRASGCVGAWDAVTALGDYDSPDGRLIFWLDKSVLSFPPGSTLLVPAGLMPYSFTTVSDHGCQMILTQSLNTDLHDFVANGCQAEPDDLPVFESEADRRGDRRERAEVLTDMYSTIQEFDAGRDYRL
jgi:hypothetical protein